MQVATENTVLENVIVGHGGSPELPRDEVVERGQGEFLVLERFFHHSSGNYDNLALVYGVLARMTPQEFYGHIGMRASGPCTADDISDHLVKAFDYGVAGELGLDAALFAYRSPDGRVVHQHST